MDIEEGHGQGHIQFRVLKLLVRVMARRVRGGPRGHWCEGHGWRNNEQRVQVG